MAWDLFQHSLTGIPVPHLDVLFSLNAKTKNPLSTEVAVSLN